MRQLNKNLFFREFRRVSMSLLLWTIVITLLISLTMSVYQTFIENQSKVLGMMSLVPKEMLQFKGISNINDMLSVLGFFSVNNIIYMMVLGSIFSIVISSNILLKEEYNKTADYLLTRPMSRTEIFVSKLAVVFISILLLNVVTALAGFLSMELVDKNPVKLKPFLVLSLYTLLLNLLFGAIGIFMSTLIKKPRSITTFSIGLVLFFYFIYTISKITESISSLGYISPFKYANVNAIDPAYRMELWHLAYFLGISLILTVAAYRIYRRKDIFV